MKNNVVPMKNFQTKQVNNFKEISEYYEEENERRINNKLHIDETVLNSKIINNEHFVNRNGQGKVVKFNNEKEISQYERQNCGNKDDNVNGSWVTCKDKFSTFPCYIVCWYIYQGEIEGYTAIYMTIEEAESDLQSSLEQVQKFKKIG